MYGVDVSKSVGGLTTLTCGTLDKKELSFSWNMRMIGYITALIGTIIFGQLPVIMLLYLSFYL